MSRSSTDLTGVMLAYARRVAIMSGVSLSCSIQLSEEETPPPSPHVVGDVDGSSVVDKRFHAVDGSNPNRLMQGSPPVLELLDDLSHWTWQGTSSTASRSASCLARAAMQLFSPLTAASWRAVLPLCGSSNWRRRRTTVLPGS